MIGDPDCTSVVGGAVGTRELVSFATGRRFRAYCDEGGWTVIQSRGQFGNPADYFFRGWKDYKEGFGTPGE